VCVLQITSLLKNHESLWTRNLAKNNESLWDRSEYDVRPLLTIIRFFFSLAGGAGKLAVLPHRKKG